MINGLWAVLMDGWRGKARKGKCEEEGLARMVRMARKSLFCSLLPPCLPPPTFHSMARLLLSWALNGMLMTIGLRCSQCAARRQQAQPTSALGVSDSIGFLLLAD